MITYIISISLPTLFFKILLVICGLLQFFAKNAGTFTGTTLNLYINLGRTEMFSLINLPSHKFNVAAHLFSLL